MSNAVYDKPPETSNNIFDNVSKDVIANHNDLVLHQFLEKQANRKKGIIDDVDILVNHKLQNIIDHNEYPIAIEPELKDET